MVEKLSAEPDEAFRAGDVGQVLGDVLVREICRVPHIPTELFRMLRKRGLQRGVTCSGITVVDGNVVGVVRMAARLGRHGRTSYVTAITAVKGALSWSAWGGEQVERKKVRRP